MVRQISATEERGALNLAAEDNGIDIGAVFGALRRHKALIFGTVFFIVALTALGTLQITPRYTATAGVMIEPREIRVIDMRPVTEGLPPSLPGDNSVVATQLKLLESRSHAERVIVKLGLAHDPEFNPPMRSAAEEIKLLVRQWLSGSWAVATRLAKQLGGSLDRPEPAMGGRPDPTNVSGEGFGAELTHPVMERFLDKLEVRQEEQSHVLTVSFTSVDPEKAARIANAVVDSYVEGQLEAKAQATERARQWVAERVDQLLEQVLQSERAVEEYRVKKDLLDSREGSLDAQQLAGLNAELISARADRVAKEARLDQVRQLRGKGNDYASLTEAASSPIIIGLREQEAQLRREEAQLSKEYGERHPRIIAVRAQRQYVAEKIDEEIGSLIRSLENEVVIARGRELAVGASLEEAKARSALAGRAAIQLRELEREAAAKRSVYEDLLTRLKEIQEQRGLLEPDAAVISTAVVPTRPSFPKVGIMMVIGSTASLMLATLLVALVEHLDRGLRTGRQVEQVLGLPSLGLVPKIEHLRRRQTPYRYLLDKPLSAYAEAVKAVQMAIELSDFDVQPQVVLVTSTLPGEGKTTLSMSLGASVARSGQKTLVVDLDLRHPSLARQLDRSVAAGLVEFMAGKHSLDEIIWTDPNYTNLHVIPVIGRTASPSELLGSQRMKSLLAELRRRYQYIILDAPPALGNTDAKVAALLADAVLFVVQWHKTTDIVALNGLESLIRCHAPVAGAALTQVDLRRHVKYGYGDVGFYYAKHRKYYAN